MIMTHADDQLKTIVYSPLIEEGTYIGFFADWIAELIVCLTHPVAIGTSLSYHFGVCCNISEITKDFDEQMSSIDENITASPNTTFNKLRVQINLHADIIR